MAVPRLDADMTDAVTDAPGPPDRVGKVARDRRRSVRLGLVALAGGVAVLVVVSWLSALWVATSPGPDVLALPAPGEAAGHLLGDGTRVWVARTTDGEVFVVEARHPESAPSGMHTSATHVVYCDEPLLESRWGSRFLADGTYLNGPALEDLRRYEVESITDERVTVGPIRSDARPDRRGQASATSDRIVGCPRDPRVVPHPAWAESFADWYRRWYDDVR